MRGATTTTASGAPRAEASDGGALYLILIQVASRGFTFLGNQFLLRYLSPSLLGLAVQLELLSVTVLYFARESLRVALQRQPPSQSTKQDKKGGFSQQVVNLAYLAVAVGLCASIGFGYGYLQRSSNEVLASPNFKTAFQLYALATILELITEPCFVVIQRHALYQARARAETVAAMVRCLSACLAASVMSKRHAPASVLPFAIGQLFYAVTLLIVYLSAVLPVSKVESFSLLPRRVVHDMTNSTPPPYLLGLFPKQMLSLATAFYAQSIFKLLLTRGDSIILSFSADLEAQGAFAFASNYGGLLSRLVFQPVEESSRNIFGRLISSSESSNTSTNSTTEVTATDTYKPTSSTKADQKVNRNKESENSDRERSHSSAPQLPLDLALTHLSTVLHLYILFTLPLVTLIPPLLPTLTSIFLPHRWRTPETITLLGKYLIYLPFLAINGILDAFVTCVATPRELRNQNLVMALITAICGTLAWVLMAQSARADSVRSMIGQTGSRGSSGLVEANMVNMALRITFSHWFVTRWVIRRGGDRGKQLERKLWKDAMPSKTCILVSAVVVLGLPRVTGKDLDLSKNFMGFKELSPEDLGYVIGGAVVVGTTILMTEHRFLIAILMPLIPERLASRIRPYLPKSDIKQQ